MDWRDVRKFGKDGRFITEDEFRDTVVDVAANIAAESDPKLAFEVTIIGVLLYKKFFEKEDK